MLSIIIPTKNRSDFLLRLLKYYRNTRYRHEIFIADSSSGLHLQVAKDAVKTFRGSLKIKYLELSNDPLHICIKRMVDIVDTPYAVFSGDDDFLIPQALQLCVDFLETNLRYVSAHGKAIVFSLHSNGLYGDIREIGPYYQRAIEEELPSQRLLNYFKNYSVPIFSVHRSNVWKKMFAGAENIPDSSFATFAGELLPGCLSSVYGKTKELDCLYLVRQVHNRRVQQPCAYDWILSKNWSLSYYKLEELVSEALLKQESLEIEEAKEIFRSGFKIYMQGLFGYSDKGAISYFKKEFKESQIFTRFFLPCYKTIRYYLSTGEFSLRRLLAKNSPYHDDLMHILNLLKEESIVKARNIQNGNQQDTV